MGLIDSSIISELIYHLTALWWIISISLTVIDIRNNVREIKNDIRKNN